MARFEDISVNRCSLSFYKYRSLINSYDIKNKIYKTYTPILQRYTKNAYLYLTSLSVREETYGFNWSIKATVSNSITLTILKSYKHFCQSWHNEIIFNDSLYLIWVILSQLTKTNISMSCTLLDRCENLSYQRRKG